MMNDLETNNEFEIKTANGKEFKLTKEFVTFEAQDKIIQEEKYTPSVIEPSFGNKLFSNILQVSVESFTVSSNIALNKEKKMLKELISLSHL